MPIYRVETDRGTFDIDADREPTADEVTQYVAGQGQQQSEADLKAQLIAKGPGDRQESAALPDSRIAEPNGMDEMGKASKKVGAGAFRYAIPLMGAMGGPVGAATNAGGETMAQLVESGKVDNPGAVARAGVVGAVPLGSAKGIMQVVRNAAKMGAGSVAGGEAESLVNTGQLAGPGQVVRDAAMGAAAPVAGAAIGAVAGKVMGRVSPEEAARIEAAKLNNAVKDETLQKMVDRGAAVVPSSVNPSAKNKLLESVAGIQNVEGGLARKNQPIFNAVAREEASLPATARLDEDALQSGRAAIADQSYDKARQYGFGQELDEWRSAANALKAAEDKAKVYTVARGQAVDDAEKALANAETALTAKATAAGDPNALKVLQEAKQAFAKNYDVQAATPTGTGDVNAALLSQMAATRGPGELTGGLRDIAQFNNAFGRSSKNPNRLASAPGAAGPGMALAAASGDPTQAAALTGGIMGIREKIRDMILSPEYQAANAVRNYTPKTSGDPAVIEMITRMVANAEAEKAREKAKGRQ